MRKLALFLFFIPLFAFAQTPRAEVFGGYSLLHAPGQNFNGWNAAATFNVYRCLGITADFSGGYWSRFTPTVLFGDVTQRVHTLTYTFGPSFTLRNKSRFTPFGHFLLGGTRFAIHNTVGSVNSSFSFNDFTVITGAGVDAGIGRRFALRPVQIDYHGFHGRDSWGNGVRYSAGVVFRFGEKK